MEVKAFGGPAPGCSIPLEGRQVKAARQDPENFYVYVVDNIAAGGQAKIAVRALHGLVLSTMLDRTTPQITYWPTLRTSDYDQIATGSARGHDGGPGLLRKQALCVGGKQGTTLSQNGARSRVPPSVTRLRSETDLCTGLCTTCNGTA